MRKAGWLSDGDWKRVQRSVPIVCADVLPVRRGRKGVEIGLICRETPHQGTRWVTVGGRVLLNEPIRKALARQVRETLGASVRAEFSTEPIAVVEYFSRMIRGEAFDPRQHAVGLTYVARMGGKVQPQGEALEFAWFTRESLPVAEIGFGQDKMLVECLEKLESVRGLGGAR